MVSADRSRRAALKQLGLAGLALSFPPIPAWASPPGWFAQGEEVIPFTDVPATFTTRGRGNVPSRIDMRELRSPITSNEDFYAFQHYPNVPQLDAATWRLETAGPIATPKTYTLDELKKRPRVERTVCFECAGNRGQGTFHGMMGNAAWTGAGLKELLQELKPQADAREVIFWAADTGKETIRNAEYTMHYARSMSLDDAMQSQAILAYEMNGQTLPVAHGFPIRLVVPGWYGVAQVKWVSKIELSDTRFVNRFMGRDYVTIIGQQVGDSVEYTERSVARQRVKSVIARVTSEANGRFRIFGVAWSDGTPLQAVDVKIDQGAWQAAKLDAQPNPFAWTFFNLEVDRLAPGAHKVVSRATDRAGHVQPASLELKKTYWEDNAQFTREIMVS